MARRRATQAPSLADIVSEATGLGLGIIELDIALDCGRKQRKKDFGGQSPLGSKMKRKAISHVGSLPTGPRTAFFRGCLPARSNKWRAFRPRPSLGDVIIAVPVWILPPRLMSDYHWHERICEGILQGGQGRPGRIDLKETVAGPVLVQSGLRSWPIFCFCQAMVAIILQRCLSFVHGGPVHHVQTVLRTVP